MPNFNDSITRIKSEYIYSKLTSLASKLPSIGNCFYQAHTLQCIETINIAALKFVREVAKRCTRLNNVHVEDVSSSHVLSSDRKEKFALNWNRGDTLIVPSSRIGV